MKIKYRRQRNTQRRLSQVLFIILLVGVFLFALAAGGVLSSIVQRGYVTTLAGVSAVEIVVQDTFNLLTPKSKLLRENQALRTQVQELQIATLYNQSLELENNELRLLLGTMSPIAPTSDTTNITIARIIDYRDIPYGTLLVKTEQGSTVKKGDIAYFGKWAIGKVTSVNNTSVLIKLFTSSGSAYDVLIGTVPGTLVGMSGGIGKISLPRTLEVSLGTPVSLPLADGLILGTVEDIERSSEQSMQTLLVRIPFNISTLRFITISDE
jgi:cell shape-determining protein MreC